MEKIEKIEMAGTYKLREGKESGVFKN